MKDSMKFGETVGVSLDRPKESVKFQGRWILEHVRDNRIISRRAIKNVVTNQGKNKNLNVCFGADAKPTWYMGLMGASSSPSVADTMLNHSGWTEFTSYAAATRPAWGPGAAASQQISNGTPVAFAINASGTVAGLFITTDNTKGGTAGDLWSGATFSSVTVVNGDTLRLTYTLTAG